MKKTLLTIVMIASGLCLNAQSQRLSLYEEFTGENCNPCASTNPALNALLALPTNTPKVVALKWEVPIPSAPTKTWSLYQTNKAEIDWRYRSVAAGGYGYPTTLTSPTVGYINSAPSGRMDGQEMNAFGLNSNHPAYLTSNVISTAASFTSAFTINMRHGWNASKTAVSVSVDIVATANFNAVGNLIFRCVMVEKLIEFDTPPGTNGEKVFKDVAIKSFPTLQGGTAMAGSWTSGQTQSFVLNCPVPSHIRKFEQMGMVGFIQDDGNRKVAQAARSNVMFDAVAETVKVDNTCSASISPELSVSNQGSETITTMTITPYLDGVAATPYVWAGSLATGASTTIQMSNLSAPAVAGAHTFSYHISGLDGADFFEWNNSKHITYLYGKDALDSSVVEGFIPPNFPPVRWGVVNADNGPSWSRFVGTGGYANSNTCSKYDFFNNKKIGDVDELLLPPINLEGTAVPELLFDYAYAQQNSANMDKLDIEVSDDCGQTWTNVYSSFGAGLVTDFTYYLQPFSPGSNSGKWSTETIYLTGFNKADVLVKFVMTNDNGNNFYLDNVNLVQSAPPPPPPPTTTTSINEAFGNNTEVVIFPNPASGTATIRISSAGDASAVISVQNTLGQFVISDIYPVKAGNNNISLDLSGLSAGIYQVSITSGNNTQTKKLNVR